MDLFASPKHQKMDDLEVTGVSRCGRVRKKSSKLVDFESIDETVEKPKKKFQQAQKSIGSLNIPGPSSLTPARTVKNEKNLISRKIKAELEHATSSTETQSSESESEENAGPNENLSTELESDNDDADALTIDERDCKSRRLEPPVHEITSQANSLYMLEKSKKKLFIKSGKIISAPKTQRKDKGKARFTAYMLWCKEIRKKLIQQCPDMDFATISKRLGELWSTVPNAEKYNWRRRAKRVVFNPNCKPSLQNDPIWKFPVPTVRNKFINKIRTVKEPKAPTTKGIKQEQTFLSNNGLVSCAKSSNRGSELKKSLIDSKTYTIVGTEPIDVAAHLTLLGESLSVIGELLTNHEGEIAISGSLSVLLDSLLCALGPLICLTKQVPEANGVEPTILSKMLDNLAYIMPGL